MITFKAGQILAAVDLNAALAEGMSVWHILPSAPDNSVGTDNDAWLDTTTGNIYTKINGVYVYQGNLKGVVGPQPYVVSAFIPGTMTNNQVVLFHVFGTAVTLAANLGITGSGEASAGSSTVNATGSTALVIAKCLAASDPTSGGSWSTVGSITFSAGGHAGALATSGGTTVIFARGDRLRVIGPVTADTTLANVSLTIAGDR